MMKYFYSLFLFSVATLAVWAQDSRVHLEVLEAMDEHYERQVELSWKQRALILDEFRGRSAEFVGAEAQMSYGLMMAEWLSEYYNRSGSDLRSDWQTESVSTWSNRERNSAVEGYLRRALADRESFRGRSVAGYDALFGLADEEQTPSPDLYFYVLRKAVEIGQYMMPSGMIDSLKAEMVEESEAYPAMHIYAYLHYVTFASHEEGLEALKQLTEQYADYDEVVLVIAKYLEMRIALYDDEGDDYFRLIDDECAQVMERYAGSRYVERIEKLQQSLRVPRFSTQMQAQFYPKVASEITLRHSNLTEVNVAAYAMYDSLEHEVYGSYYAYRNRECLEVADGEKPVWSRRVELVSPLNISEETIVDMRLNKVGDYWLVFSNAEGEAILSTRVSVSRVGFVLKPSLNQPEVYAADFRTGKPLKNIDLKIWGRDTKEMQQTKVRIDGFSPFALDAEMCGSTNKVKVGAGRDVYAPSTTTALKTYQYRENDLELNYATDRRRYYSGDTVRFRAVAYTRKGGVRVLEGEKMFFALKLHGKEIARTIMLTSDEWGVLHGELVIPEQGIMNGHYRLEASVSANESGTMSVNIDHYVMPTYEVALAPERTHYGVGDTVCVAGKLTSYTGHLVEGTRVGYRIMERGFHYGAEKLVAEGEVEADELGAFAVQFTVEKGDDPKAYKTYEVVATAVSTSGETHQGEVNISVYERKVSLKIEGLKASFTKESKPQLVIKSMSSYSSSAALNYRILAVDDSIAVLSDSCLLGDTLRLDWEQFRSGTYRMEVTGERVFAKVQQFAVFSMEDEAIPTTEACFFSPEKSECEAGKGMAFWLGTNAKRQYVVLEVYGKNDTIYYRENLVVKRGMMRYELPYMTDYPDQVRLLLTSIYDGKVWQFDHAYERTEVDRTLKMKFVSLRDRSRPGMREEFGIEVTDVDGRPQQASIVLTAYNKASDAPFVHAFSELNIAPRRLYRKRIVGGGGFRVDGKSMWHRDVPGVNVLYNSSEESLPDEMSVGSDVRKRFRKTAVFRSDLVTDAQGEAAVNFTYPDNLAMYRIMAQAVTKDARSVVHSAEVEVTKEVMVSAYLPQFVREGDVVTIRAQVSNLTHEVVRAQLGIQVSEEITEGAEAGVLELKPRSTQVVEFTVRVSGEKDMLDLQLALESDQHKDVEVTRVPVIAAVDMERRSGVYVHREEVQTIDLREFISYRPAQNEEMVVQSMSARSLLLLTLPRLEERGSASLLTTLSNWQVVGIASHLASSRKPLIEGWMKQYVNDTIVSEVNGLAESETPWTFTSKRAQVERLMEWTDRAENAKALRDYALKIERYKQTDGGYAWYVGMPSSPSVTMRVLDAYLSLAEANVCNLEAKNYVYNYAPAVRYLDKRMYEQWQDTLVGSRLSNEDLEYMRVRGQYAEYVPFDEKSTASWAYYVARAQKEWKEYSLLDKARVAMALNAVGEDVSEIVANIAEYAAEGEQGSVYFPNAVMPWRGMVNSELYAHTMLLKLFRSLPKRYIELEDNLAVWLMLQRRAQVWSDKSTAVNAAQVLIKHFYESPESRGKEMGPAQGEPHEWWKSLSNNYVDRYMPSEGTYIDLVALRKGSGKVQIRSTNDDVLFTEVIYTCEKRLREMKASATGYELERKLYRVVGNKEELITKGTTLQVGDEVVARYRIQSTDNRHFVQVRALRTGALRPLDNVSGYRTGQYYREVKANATNYFFYLMPEGENFIEERFMVEYGGEFNDGYMRVDCLMAPVYQGNTVTNYVAVE